jgi:hypothetical protein
MNRDINEILQREEYKWINDKGYQYVCTERG